MKLPLRLWPRAALTLYRTFGSRGLLLRLAHERRRSTGKFRPAPLHPLANDHLVSAATIGTFAVDRWRLASATGDASGMERAERAFSGFHQAYRWTWLPLPTSPSQWVVHPTTHQPFRADLPWWQVTHLDPSAGDIKDLWEPARFGWAYDLIRGYVLSGDDRFADVFFRHLESWSESSPPFLGPHWSCGQETAIRAAALLYAEANLADAPSATPERIALLRAILAASGERIRNAVGYAISQRNNHAISEAAGLVLLGVRLEGVHPEAREWLNTGQRLLERLVVEQFASDGWYIQHSFTYLRLALDQLVLAERSLRSVGRSLSRPAIGRVGAAVNLILSVIEPTTGVVPNHGANDGAFVHPITSAGYRDFRPILTAVCAMWSIGLPRNIAIDHEVLAWLKLDAPPAVDPISDGLYTGESGWAAIRIADTAAFLRAGSYTSRPGHIDPLHLDIRLGKREVVVDPGTYAYNASPPWRNGLAAGKVHNGPVVGGREPGVRGPRFLWYIWPESHIVSSAGAPDGFELVAEIPGVVRRVVRVSAGRVEVEDRLLTTPGPDGEVCWLLHPEADPTRVHAVGREIFEAQESDVRGWFSPAYGVRIPSRWVRVRWGGDGGRVARTVITDGGVDTAVGDAS